MNSRSSSEHLASALIRAEAGEKGAAAPPPAFTIALSREVGARGTSVSREAGARLGWPVYEDEILQRVAQEMKLQVHLLERVDERHPSPLQEFIELFSPGGRAKEADFIRHLTKTLMALAAQGGCIIVGRGAAQLLPAETTLRVRLMARLEDRIAVMSRELGIPYEEAARHVEQTDRERIRFVQNHFHRDPTDPQHYDLVVNSSRFSVVECAELVIEALRRLQARAPARAASAPR
jgi:cytidylate kinase